MKKLACILLLSAAANLAFGQDADSSKQSVHAMRLFEEGCFKNGGNPQQVREWARSSVLLDMPDEAAKAFLGGQPGRAWAATNGLGSFVISAADRGICTVYARKANVVLIKERYLAFLPKTEAGMLVEKKTDETRKTPSGDVYTLGHAISSDGGSKIISIALSTADNDQAAMQAVISLVISSK
jgi:hypothetical protein